VVHVLLRGILAIETGLPCFESALNDRTGMDSDAAGIADQEIGYPPSEAGANDRRVATHGHGA
jgi:hypothetical protein